MNECVVICNMTSGGFTFNQLKSLDYEDFMIVRNISAKLQKGGEE